MVVHVEDDVLAHHGQADEGDVGDGLGHFFVVAGVGGGGGGAEADAHCNEHTTR